MIYERWYRDKPDLGGNALRQSNLEFDRKLRCKTLVRHFLIAGAAFVATAVVVAAMLLPY